MVISKSTAHFSIPKIANFSCFSYISSPIRGIAAKKAPVIKKAPPCCVPIFNKGGLS